MGKGRFGFLVACVLLASCGSGSDTVEDVRPPAVDAAEVPAPSHVLNGRKLTVRLPYDGTAMQVWLLGQQEDAIAPFSAWDIDQSPVAGSGGRIGVTTMTFTANGPGSVTLDFLLVPAGKTLFGPPETRFVGTPANKYQVAVTVN